MEARCHGTLVCHATFVDMNTVEITEEATEWGETVRRELKEVILVLSSSRGGSSVFTEYLRHSNALLHMRGEINPWLSKCGLSYPNSGTGSDALGEEELLGKSEALWTWLGSEIGNMSTTSQAWNQFPNQLHRRLQLQWPEKSLDTDTINTAVKTVLGRWPSFKSQIGLCPERFHLALIRQLQNMGLTHIRPHWYDIADDSLFEWGWDPSQLGEIPSLIEEPPLVLITPWKRPSIKDLRSKPLVIKTPSNAYRIPFLRAFFSNQKLRIIHLKREPAAAINGLYDGWRYPRGFHAHRIPSCQPKTCEEHGPQPVSGYWKYDLPPGWKEVEKNLLVEICAFQWLSSHKHILKSDTGDGKPLGIWFENLLGPNSRNEINRLLNWLDIDADEHLRHKVLEDLPPIMATQRPRRSRWFSRAALIQPQLERNEIQDVWRQLKHG